jgi:hypothetical protein
MGNSSSGDQRMARGMKIPAVNEKLVREMLDRYACPLTYHEIRTRFLGSLSTPDAKVSPMGVIQSLWGGELPPCDSMDDLNELLEALVNGLWNPLRLVKMAVEPTPEGLVVFTVTRMQELDGFLEGLLNGKVEVDLPEKAARSMDVLAELRSLFAGTFDLLKITKDDPDRPDKVEIEKTLSNLQRLTPIMEKEIHAVVLDCTRARRDAIKNGPFGTPTFH